MEIFSRANPYWRNCMDYRAPSSVTTMILSLIEREQLIALGIGYIDVHLIASVRLMAGSTLWTRDKRLHGVANRLGLAADIS